MEKKSPQIGQEKWKKWKHHLEEANTEKSPKKTRLCLFTILFWINSLQPHRPKNSPTKSHTLKSSKNFSGSSEASALTRIIVSLKDQTLGGGGGFCVPTNFTWPKNKNKSSWIGTRVSCWKLVTS